MLTDCRIQRRYPRVPQQQALGYATRQVSVPDLARRDAVHGALKSFNRLTSFAHKPLGRCHSPQVGLCSLRLSTFDFVGACKFVECLLPSAKTKQNGGSIRNARGRLVLPCYWLCVICSQCICISMCFSQLPRINCLPFHA